MTDYSKEALEEAAVSCYNWSQVLRFLGLKTFSGNFQTVKRKFEEHKINSSHFKGKSHPAWNKGQACANRWGARVKLVDVLNNSVPYTNTSVLKSRLFKEGFKRRVCEECKLGELYNNKPIVLQLDHKDGNRKNNAIENLRILCPNCHSQTETFSGKNVS
jgi:hypothetical protein